MFEQSFRFFHDLFFPESFPKNQEKIKKDQRRQIDKRFKIIRDSKYEIADKKEKRAQSDPEGQRFGRVLAERRSVVFRFVFQ
jgi:hypothetical protein